MSLYTSEQLAFFAAHKGDDKRPDLIATVAICLPVSSIAVILRVVCRRLTNVPLLTDDWLVIIAEVATTSMLVSIAVAVSCGFGAHIPFASNLVGFAKSVLAIETSYSIAVILTKLSILFLYRRIFPLRAVTFWACVVGSVVVVYSTALIVVTFTACIPLHKLWTPFAHGWCMNTSVPFTTLAIANVVTDAAILLLPVKHVWNLQMSRTRKYSVLCIFLLGGIVCIFGIIRCTVVGEADAIDPTWTNVKGGVWSAVELSVGIVCACLPTFGPLFTRIAQLSNSSYGRSPKSSSGRHSSSKKYGLCPRDITMSAHSRAPRAWPQPEPRDEYSDQRPIAVSVGQSGRAPNLPLQGIQVERTVAVC